jgi:hypothetical protein
MGDPLLQDLVRRLALAGRDERRVMERLLARLELGRRRYGELDIAAPRNWRRDFGEELLDALIYDTIEELRQEDAAHDQEQARAAAELAELRAWEERDRRTVVSGESHRLALEDLAEPYEDVDVSEFSGEGG